MIDRAEAEEFLRQFKFDFTIMLELRELLTATDPLSRMSDDRVIETVASRLATCEFVFSRLSPIAVEAPTGGGAAQQKAEEPQVAVTPSRPAQRVAEPPPPTFAGNHDAAAQAAALVEAAEQGVPFCEECEKRRRAAA